MLDRIVEGLFTILPVYLSGIFRFVQRRIRLCSSLALIFLVLVMLFNPLLIYYLVHYTKLIVREILADHARLLDNDVQLAEKEWRLYELEKRYGRKWCQDNHIKSRADWTWLTAMVNDDFAVPALVLGHLIQKFSCQRNMIALVSADVTVGAREALNKVGWTVKEVERLDCDWMERKKGRKESHSGYIGTHTRFHAWNYTKYTKIIYADPDFMPMTRIDELFDLEGDFAASTCSRPGILDPCFNAGLLVFRPDENHYKGIIDLWWKTSDDHCPNDQVLLWHYYINAGKWTQLPYSYNVRRITYRPMKAYHFACCVPPKPWAARCRPNRKEANIYNKPILDVQSLAVLFWKHVYEALEEYHIDDWWRSTRFYKKEQEFGEVTSSECWNAPGP